MYVIGLCFNVILAQTDRYILFSICTYNRILVQIVKFNLLHAHLSIFDYLISLHKLMIYSINVFCFHLHVGVYWCKNQVYSFETHNIYSFPLYPCTNCLINVINVISFKIIYIYFCNGWIHKAFLINTINTYSFRYNQKLTCTNNV